MQTRSSTRKNLKRRASSSDDEAAQVKQPRNSREQINASRQAAPSRPSETVVAAVEEPVLVKQLPPNPERALPVRVKLVCRGPTTDDNTEDSASDAAGAMTSAVATMGDSTPSAGTAPLISLTIQSIREPGTEPLETLVLPKSQVRRVKLSVAKPKPAAPNTPRRQLNPQARRMALDAISGRNPKVPIPMSSPVAFQPVVYTIPSLLQYPVSAVRRQSFKNPFLSGAD